MSDDPREELYREVEAWRKGMSSRWRKVWGALAVLPTLGLLGYAFSVMPPVVQSLMASVAIGLGIGAIVCIGLWGAKELREGVREK